MKTTFFFKVGNYFTAFLVSAFAYSQTTINGSVLDAETQQPLPGAAVLIAGLGTGTVTDFDGNFSLTTNADLPFTLQISSIGFGTKTIEVTSADQSLSVALETSQNELEEIILSASRTPERIAESPVSVERLSLKDIENTTSPDFYTSLENLKGVDVNYSAIGFASVNTRGFAGFANTRFLQLVDGMDNAAPGLNFSVGNLLGLNQLDVASLELLPGASSALYGANAFNGILFMTSKSPFDSEGVSAYAKTGINSSSNNGDNTYYDVAVRAAFKLSDNFAVKFNVSHYEGKEWAATDFRQYTDAGAGVSDQITTRTNQTVFNGLNTYGDEVTLSALGESVLGVSNLDVAGFGGYLIQTGVLPDELAPVLAAGAGAGVNVSMPGFNEQQLYNGDATSTKFDVSLHFKLSENTELSWVSKLGMGNSIYQGASRYILKNFFLHQHKLELRGDNFFLRGYVTAEDAKDAYDGVQTGIGLSQVFAENWFGTYTGTYLGTIAAGGTADVAASTAYSAANATLPVPGSTEFQTAFDQVTSTPLYEGSKFTDKTKLYHFDGNYNFRDQIKIAEIQIGASYRVYDLNSFGSIFTDRDSGIDFAEYGIYLQAQRNLGDHLKFTGSIRYDNAENFDGNYSPRVSFVWTPDEARNHNFRLSYQTGFRYPTTQNQYIGLETPIGTLLGAAPDNFDRFESTPRSVSSDLAPIFAAVPSINVYNTLSGVNVRDNSFTATSVGTFAATADVSALRKAVVEEIQPEEVTAYEVGYRGRLFDILFVDASFYYNEYENFISANNVITPHYGSADLTNTAEYIPAAFVGADTPASVLAIVNGDFTVYSITANSAAKVTSKGFNIGVDTNLGGMDLGVSYTYADFDFDQTQDPDFEAGFNTPKNTYKISLSKEDLFENVGFGLNFRHLDSYLWEATFADGIIPSRTMLDAQITYNWNKLAFKVGGSNLLGEEYVSGPGTGLVGTTYFVGLTFQP